MRVKNIPLNNIKVWLVGKDTSYTYSNCEGEFLFYDIADGSYKVNVNSKSFDNFTKEVIVRDGAIINLEVDLTPNNDIFTGIVTDIDGTPVKNAFIGVYSNKKLIATTKTNQLGEYVLTNFDKRKYVVKAVTNDMIVTYTVL